MAFKVDIQQSKKLPNVMVVKPDVFFDFRGDMWTNFDKKTHHILPDDLDFNHWKFTRSRKNVLRGLHGDNETWKYMTCVSGEIYHVILDPKTGVWDSWIVGDNNRISILVPPGLVNGHLCLSDECVFHYAQSYPNDYVDYDGQMHIKWNDVKYDIDWPVKDPILGRRDR
tara:strand:+ start:847 stop:1353 length:507 start_codon:yes stop_codon:yes gene_type:complete